MKSLMVMMLPLGQVQDLGKALKPMPLHGGPVKVFGLKVEPSRQEQKEGSVPLPQLGRSYLLTTLSARSLILKVFLLGQVQLSGRAFPEQGLVL